MNYSNSSYSFLLQFNLRYSFVFWFLIIYYMYYIYNSLYLEVLLDNVISLGQL